MTRTEAETSVLRQMLSQLRLLRQRGEIMVAKAALAEEERISRRLELNSSLRLSKPRALPAAVATADSGEVKP